MHQPELSFELCQVMHRLSSVFELWQKGATTPDREVHPPELSLRALPGGATSPVKRCNRLIPEILGFDRFDRFELEF